MGSRLPIQNVNRCTYIFPALRIMRLCKLGKQGWYEEKTDRKAADGAAGDRNYGGSICFVKIYTAFSDPFFTCLLDGAFRAAGLQVAAQKILAGRRHLGVYSCDGNLCSAVDRGILFGRVVFGAAFSGSQTSSGLCSVSMQMA